MRLFNYNRKIILKLVVESWINRDIDYLCWYDSAHTFFTYHSKNCGFLCKHYAHRVIRSLRKGSNAQFQFRWEQFAIIKPRLYSCKSITKTCL